MAAVAVHCGDCGTEWSVAPKTDGTMPVTSRCPKARGGCGKLRKVPRQQTAVQAAAAVRAASAAPATWDPPSEPRPARAAGNCSECGGPVTSEPRGVGLWCTGCDTHVTPPGVRAPYQRGGEVTRTAKSQRDRDLEAVALARRKGLMLAQLAQLAADDRLHPESVPVVEWFTDQVQAAASDGRLSELVALLPEAGIRRRHWWQGQPAAIGAYLEDDEDDEDLEDGQGAAVTGVASETPVSIPEQRRTEPQRMTWAEAIAACGHRVAPAADGLCQIIDSEGRCTGMSSRHLGRFPVGNVFACGWHTNTLATVIREHSQRISA